MRPSAEPASSNSVSGNSFGQAFRITTAGESHGPGNVVIIDGCPPGVALDAEMLAVDLNRRRPGQSKIVTQRQEADEPEILSGVFEGKTTGTSIAILIRNTDARSRDYSKIMDTYRPGHADYTYDRKYGFRDYRGGGRSSARETTARVAAGAVAKQLLASHLGVRIVGYVKQVGDIVASVDDPASVTLEQVETLPSGEPNIVRCPDHAQVDAMVKLIEAVRKDQDSIGGVAELVAIGVPPGLGEPVFDKLKADLAKALFSLPAVLGVEYGSGFACARMRGSEHNDPFLPGAPGRPRTASNRSGGVQGGISNGEPIWVRVAFKPTATIAKPQQTVDREGRPVTLEARGRHDPCVLPRAVPMVEAMVCLVLADHWLRQRALDALPR